MQNGILGQNYMCLSFGFKVSKKCKYKRFFAMFCMGITKRKIQCCVMLVMNYSLCGRMGGNPWMKEAMDNTSRVGVCLRCPVFISVHFSLRNEGSSEYIRCVKGERAWARIFKLFMTPGINSTELVHWSRKPFILLLHSHCYIWFHGHFYTA